MVFLKKMVVFANMINLSVHNIDYKMGAQKAHGFNRGMNGQKFKYFVNTMYRMWSGCPKAGIRLQTEMSEERFQHYNPKSLKG